MSFVHKVRNFLSRPSRAELLKKIHDKCQEQWELTQEIDIHANLNGSLLADAHEARDVETDLRKKIYCLASFLGSLEKENGELKAKVRTKGIAISALEYRVDYLAAGNDCLRSQLADEKKSAAFFYERKETMLAKSSSHTAELEAVIIDLIQATGRGGRWSPGYTSKNSVADHEIHDRAKRLLGL